MPHDFLLGEYDAHNSVTPKSNGKWEDGEYEMEDQVSRHTHGNDKEPNGVLQDSPNGRYGKGGVYRAKEFKETTSKAVRNGMSVHAGRENKPFFSRRTEGCIRTTPEAMEAIDKAIKNKGPLQKIIIQNNRPSQYSEKVNGIKPRFLRMFTLTLPIVLQDKTRVAFSF